jgi:hypothetical protein
MNYAVGGDRSSGGRRQYVTDHKLAVRIVIKRGVLPVPVRSVREMEEEPADTVDGGGSFESSLTGGPEPVGP